jgi:hypothetical protein
MLLKVHFELTLSIPVGGMLVGGELILSMMDSISTFTCTVSSEGTAVLCVDD